MPLVEPYAHTFQNCRRFSTAPTVSCQTGYVPAVYPSTKSPPGKRMNRGCRAAIASARSFRVPFSRPFHVSTGISETASIQKVCVLSDVIVRTACSESPVAVNTWEYFCHTYDGVIEKRPLSGFSRESSKATWMRRGYDDALFA